MALNGRTILVTRQHEQAAELLQVIGGRGGRAVVLPMIRISDPESWEGCDKALDVLSSYDAVVFTSTNGVNKFLGRLKTREISPATLRRLEIFAVGPKTKEAIERQGISVAFVPVEYTADALVRRLLATGVSGRRFLLPQGNLAGQDVRDALAANGAKVETVTVYRNDPPDEHVLLELRNRFLLGEFDAVILASPSAVNNFSRAVPPEAFGARSAVFCVIGPATRKAALALNYNIDIEAGESTSEGLVDAISRYFLLLTDRTTKTGIV